MQLQLDHEIRDPIHGLVHLTEQELRIVNTPVFQRLRRIRQLAMADLVYPGALHTRFEHSIGALHVASRILERLDRDEHLSDNDAVAVRLAALLHDVGHGPFSHVSEHLLDKWYARELIGSATSREKIHEKITVDIITKDPGIVGLIGANEREVITSIIQGSGVRDYRRDIVSSSLDVDKMDYLLRDAYYAGVRYGQYDLDKIVDSLRVHRSGSESYLAVDEGGIFAVEQLIHSKHHMTQQVYAHRVRVVTDFMIVRGLQLAIETDASIQKIYAYDGSDEHLRRYLEADDARISAAVLSCGDDRARAIFQRLRDRNLFKELSLIRIDKADIPNAAVRSRIQRISAESCRRIEQAVAEKIGCQPWEVIVEKKTVKNPAYHEHGSIDPDTIMIVGRSGGPEALSELEEVADAKVRATERLHVVGPWNPVTGMSRDDGHQARRTLSERVKELILDYVGGHP